MDNCPGCKLLLKTLDKFYHKKLTMGYISFKSNKKNDSGNEADVDSDSKEE